MASDRRIGLEDSETRALLLDATEQIMSEEGYAAVSSRRIAKQAGLKHQLVYYYFRTMDDLFLALVRRRTERGLERLTRALSSESPVRAVWEFHRDPTDTVLTIELMALANHRKAVAAEIKRYGEQIRIMQVGAVSRILKDRGVDPAEYPPVALMFLANAISRCIVMEDVLGYSTGHREIEMIVERWLREFDEETQQRTSGSSSGRKRASQAGIRRVR